jgi:hypothetical protein
MQIDSSFMHEVVMICRQCSHLWSESDSRAARTEDLSDWLCLLRTDYWSTFLTYCSFMLMK